MSAGGGLDEAGRRLVGKLPEHGTVVVTGGSGKFPAAGLASLRRDVWGDAEGTLVVPAGRVDGLPRDEWVVPTLRDEPVRGVEADHFHVYASAQRATEAHPGWSPSARPDQVKASSSAGEHGAVSARQALAGTSRPAHEPTVGPTQTPTPTNGGGPRVPPEPHTPGPPPARQGPGNDPFGGPLERDSALAAGPQGTRHPGWETADRHGTLWLGDGVDGQPRLLDVPAGTRALVDGSGERRLVVLPDGLSYDRDLRGAWSRGRVDTDEIKVREFANPLHLRLADGKTHTLRSGAEIRDQLTGKPVAFRARQEFAGSAPVYRRMFLPAAGGRWEPVDMPGAEVDAWMAAARKQFDTAGILNDTAARYRLSLPAGQRLNNLDNAVLDTMLQGGELDSAAAIYEMVRRNLGCGYALLTG